MRIPPRPPSVAEEFESRSGDLLSAWSNRTYTDLSRQSWERYWHWDRLRFVAPRHSADPHLLWAIVKVNRQQQYRYLPLMGAPGQPLCYCMPGPVQRELMLIDQELAGTLAAGDEQPLSASQRERFIVNALREEAIASSMLEGAATTRRVAKEMLKSGRKPRDRGEQMVLNNYRAISFVREHRGVPLTPEFLLELQTILTQDTLDDPSECGRLRTTEDDVAVVDAYGELLHTPPPASELPGRLASLCKFANATDDDGEFMHPVLRAMTLHFQIGYVHPFCDGNGRTARALFYWHMLRRGYWLFEYLPISRLIYQGPAKYGRAFLYVETDDFDLTYFFRYHLKVIERCRSDLREYIRRKRREMSRARDLFSGDPMLNHRQRETITRLLRHPHLSISIANHQGEHNIAYATAHADLLGLLNRGYLRKDQIGKRFEFIRGPKLEGIESP